MRGLFPADKGPLIYAAALRLTPRSCSRGSALWRAGYVPQSVLGGGSGTLTGAPQRGYITTVGPRIAARIFVDKSPVDE